MDEVSIITNFIQDKAGLSADLIWGNCSDESLGDSLSVTIIATGFQTSEQRVNEEKSKKKITVLLPDEAPLVRPVEPVNSFIQHKEAPSYEPVLKAKEEPAQPDLFGGFFSKAKVNKTKGNDEVRHSLEEEEKPQDDDEPNADGFEFEVKVAETQYVFDKPIGKQEKEVEPVHQIPAVEEPVAGLDDDKDDASMEEQLRKSKERIMRLKDLSMKLRTSNGLQELENEPAYKRKQMQLQEVQHSSESQVSRFTLSNDKDGTTEIRPNNSFLHDNVD